MPLKETLTCYECSRLKLPVKVFPRGEIVNFNGRNYCPQHYKEAVERQKFNNYVCELFGIKSPGPKIFNQRKRLNEQGFTDATICHTLDYLFNIKKMSKAYESLGLINQRTVDEAYEYHLSQKGKTVELKENKIVEHTVSVKKTERKKNILEYDFLDD